MREVVKNITSRLQTADLTINFGAASFFSTENTTTTYKQMFDKAQRDVTQADGTTKREMRLADNPDNPALVRDTTDTKVTFGQNVAKPGMQGVARFMQTGGLTPTGTNNAAGNAEYVANNPHFNPKARQIFSGLNYTRFAHGAVPFWGCSHFILRDSLKINAIYYVGDTFYGASTDSRVSYGMLFALAIKGSDKFVTNVLNSCYRQTIFQSANLTEAVEAHLFEEISFSKDVKEMRISIGDVQRNTRKALLADPPTKTVAEIDAWQQAIWANANKFARKHGIIISSTP
jgi:hypothetical protein